MARPRLVRMPASLLGRTNLTLTISAALISIVSTIALYTFVIDPIAEKSADDEAALLVLSAQTWVELPPEARPFFELELAQNHDLIISQVIQEFPEYQGSDSAIGLLVTKLEDRLFGEVTVLDGDDLVWVELSMGGYEFQIGVSPDRQQIQPLNVAIVIVSLGAGIVFFTSLLVVQRVTKPLVKISKQAERFRGDENIEPLPETGPRELISLARNFNTMAADISRLLANRTTLMAGISHDLRTPLTRMKLQIAFIKDKDIANKLNIPTEKRVYPLASSENNHMIATLQRPNLIEPYGMKKASDFILQICDSNNIKPNIFDLYSCFPVAVQMFSRLLNVKKPKDMTITGGMSFAVGPFNSYVIHSTIKMISKIY